MVDFSCRPCRGSLLVLLLLPMAHAMGHIVPPLRGFLRPPADGRITLAHGATSGEMVPAQPKAFHPSADGQSAQRKRDPEYEAKAYRLPANVRSGLVPRCWNEGAGALRHNVARNGT